MLAGCSEGIGGVDFLTNLSGNNKIYYTTTDGEKVYLHHWGGFDSVLISHTYKNGKGCLTFDEEVTIIGDCAFNDCRNLLSIEIPDSVTSIGCDAFYNCTSLTSITIPDSVTSIEDEAFFYCSSLTSVTIGNGVIGINGSTFRNCSSLTSVTIGSGVTYIGESAFSRCASLTRVYCKATTPPRGSSGMLFGNSLNPSELKIYVPTESVDAYKTAEYWSNYKPCIYGYDF